MSDFFPFEFIDDEAEIVHEGDGSEYRAVARKNQSLSGKSAEYLRQAMSRLVPTTFVYGDSGIGNRAYELFVLCYIHAFIGVRSSLLVAAVCVMHASYERRSDLVILPMDIEAKFGHLKTQQMRYNRILQVYDDMCQSLKLPRLGPSMEKILDRIFRTGCCFKVESEIFEYTQMALSISREIRSSIPETSIPNVGGSVKSRRKSYSNNFRIETIAACSAILACRYFKRTDVTSIRVADELHISRNAISYCLKKYTACKGIEKLTRTAPVQVGDMTIPRGLSLRPRDCGSTGPGDEIFALTDTVHALVPLSDNLGFLFGNTETTRSDEDAAPIPSIASPPKRGRRIEIVKSVVPSNPDKPALPSSEQPVSAEMDSVLADFSDLL